MPKTRVPITSSDPHHAAKQDMLNGETRAVITTVRPEPTQQTFDLIKAMDGALKSLAGHHAFVRPICEVLPLDGQDGPLLLADVRDTDPFRQLIASMQKCQNAGAKKYFKYLYHLALSTLVDSDILEFMLKMAIHQCNRGSRMTGPIPHAVEIKINVAGFVDTVEMDVPVPDSLKWLLPLAINYTNLVFHNTFHETVRTRSANDKLIIKFVLWLKAQNAAGTKFSGFKELWAAYNRAATSAGDHTTTTRREAITYVTGLNQAARSSLPDALERFNQMFQHIYNNILADDELEYTEAESDTIFNHEMALRGPIVHAQCLSNVLCGFTFFNHRIPGSQSFSAYLAYPEIKCQDDVLSMTPRDEHLECQVTSLVQKNAHVLHKAVGFKCQLTDVTSLREEIRENLMTHWVVYSNDEFQSVEIPRAKLEDLIQTINRTLALATASGKYADWLNNMV